MPIISEGQYKTFDYSNLSKVFEVLKKLWYSGISQVVRFSDILNILLLRHEVAYFDCSAKALSLCLNPASRRCDPMEACAQGASLTGMKPSWQCAEVCLRRRCGSREVEALLEAPSGWGVRIGYYGQRKWTLVTVVNIDKPKELWGLNQKGKWVVRMGCWTSDTGTIPTGRQSGPKVFAVDYVERGNLMPLPQFGAG